MATVRDIIERVDFQRAIRTAAVGGDDNAVLRAASECLDRAGFRVTIPANLRTIVEAATDPTLVPDGLLSADLLVFTDGAYGIVPQQAVEKVALAGQDPVELLVDMERKIIKLLEGSVNHILALYDRDPKGTVAALQQLGREHDHAQVSPTDHWLRDVKATAVKEMLRRCKVAIKDDGKSVRRASVTVEANMEPIPLHVEIDPETGEFNVRTSVKSGVTSYDSIDDLIDHVKGWAKVMMRKVRR